MIPFSLVSVVVAAAAVSQTPTIAGDEPASTAEVLAALAKRPASPEPDSLYFELTINGQVAGCSSYTLTPRGTKGEEGFDYRVESLLQPPMAARVLTTVTAKLSLAFQPQEMETVRDVTAPGGTRERSRTTAFVSNDVLIVERQVDDEEIVANTVAIPKQPYVAAVEFIVQRLDLRKFKKFELREFNPQNGDVIDQRFSLTPLERDKLELRSTRANGMIDYRFTLDDAGRLTAMQKSPLPMVATRTTRQQFEQLRRRFSGS